ncbi:unnamed protein product [Adineta steineri]|uniref:Uncharacterized protein n=3 Tax=Adineta steineri TaxID=433720 RepID=A0A815GXH3_9BILA|nr:unnamed protein product [Adineta steineri]CAF3654344.1 unnamed protein product [Adineta steineri]
MTTAVETTGNVHCVTCEQANVLYACEGCSQRFSFDHLKDHRRGLNRQVDTITNERKNVVQILTKQKADPLSHFLAKQIGDWERRSVNKIRRAADEARDLFLTYVSEYISELEFEFTDLSPQLTRIKQENVIDEINLKESKQKLLRIKKELVKLPNIILQQDPSPFVSKLFVVDSRRVNRQGDVNLQYHQQLSPYDNPSLRGSRKNSTTSTINSRHKPAVHLLNEPDFSHQVKTPVQPLMDISTSDMNNKVLRVIKSSLNKLTTQTYDKIQQQLETLEIDRYEQLKGMIDIFFLKAVDEPAFCSLYAKLCRQFQKKRVTALGQDGKTVTYSFRQILLTRCQTEFENDYRQEIGYEKRKNELGAITDEKQRAEEAEKLEEDLIKAKLRKLGNIFFIGELFKLQMLTDNIIYGCIEYLLFGKPNEENLEFLCCLLHTIGKELDEKSSNESKLDKYYRELDNINKEHRTSERIHSMIHELLELRRASWVAHPIEEANPTTIYESLGQDRDQQQLHGTTTGTAHPRNDEDKVENSLNVSLLKLLQSNDKQSQGQSVVGLAPKGSWAERSEIEIRLEQARLLAERANKSSAEPVQQVKIEISPSQDDLSHPLQDQSPFELAREHSHRDRENALQSLRKTITASGINSSVNASLSSSITISCEDSFNISRKESCNISHASSVSELTSISSVTPQIREQTQARVHSLVEEYTEKYPLFSDRPVKEGLQDLFAFYTPSHDQQAIIVRELFKNNLEAKPLARQGAGHLLNATLNGGIISTDAFISGFQMILEVAVDYAIDVPEIWQYFGEIIGAFIGGSTSNMSLIKPILQSVPEDISNELFQYIIHYATEFSSQSRIQGFWHASGISIKDVLKSDRIDPSFMEAYDWLFAKPENEPLTVQTKENFLPRADSQLVTLFKSVNDQEIITYISEHMDPHEKFCIRNIVLSYLEACLDTHNSQKKIQEDIARERMTILNEIIEHDPEVELEAVYAIQNFVNKLGNPPKMALQLFHIFYDEECISEDTFYDWLDEPDPSDTEVRDCLCAFQNNTPSYVDGGGIERWEDPEYRSCYSSIFQGRLKENDFFDATHRLRAQMSLYNMAVSPSGGGLLVNPLLKLTTSYWLLRLFFRRIKENDSWEIDESSIWQGAVPGRIQEMNDSLHPDLALSTSMVSVPAVNPGDMIFWHCDTIHAVDPIHGGQSDSSVFYIPAAPLCDVNAEYLVRQRHSFEYGIPAPDFPGGKGESNHIGRATTKCVNTVEGKRTMGLESFEIKPHMTSGEKEMILQANNILNL